MPRGLKRPDQERCAGHGFVQSTNGMLYPGGQLWCDVNVSLYTDIDDTISAAFEFVDADCR
jgi:hypothetical protein